jgi:hypothetical protein
MTERDEERFEKLMRDAADTFRRPPEPPVDEMWAAIEAHAGLGVTTRSGSITPITAARRQSRVPRWLGIAATLVIGIGIGRGSTSIGRDAVRVPPQTVAVVAPTPVKSAIPRNDPSLDRPYEVETSQYLGQTAALLTALPSEAKSGHPDQQFAAQASDLLARTRLLIDSPAANEPAMHDLLEDLELVLVQVVRLRNNGTRTDLDIINRALEQRDVIPRLRTAVADISAN